MRMNHPAIMVNNSSLIPTIEKYQEVMEPQVDQLIGYSQEIEIGEDFVAVLSEDAAIHVFEVNTLIKDSEGKRLIKETGMATIVYAKRNDIWKILHIHNSYDKIDL